MRSLVRALLLPRVTYGLPFCELTDLQYQKLNALVLRPLLTQLRLPTHVHRAGVAHTVGIPVLEIQRDQSLLALGASILRLVENDVARGGDVTAFPTFELCWNAWHQRAVRTADLGRFDARSPIDQFIRAARHFEVIDELPLEQQLPRIRNRILTSPPAWSASALTKAIAAAAGRLQLHRVIVQSRGHDIQVGGLNHGTAHVRRDAAKHQRGRTLAPLLGVPETVKKLSDIAKVVRELARDAPGGPAPWLEHDTRDVAPIRARLTLNRSELAAVRYARDPRAELQPSLLGCAHCKAVENADTPETALHAIATCSKYEQARATLARKFELKQKLKAARAKLRAAQQSLPLDGRVIRTDAEFFMHACLATPVVLRFLDRKMHKWLCKCTGDFLLHISSSRRHADA